MELPHSKNDYNDTKHKRLVIILSAVVVIGVVAVVLMLFLNLSTSPSQVNSASPSSISATSANSGIPTAEITVENSSGSFRNGNITNYNISRYPATGGKITAVNRTISNKTGYPGFGNTTFPGGDNGLTSISSLFASSSTLSQSLVDKIQNINSVYAVSPVLSSSAYVDGKPAMVYGIDPSTYSKVFGSLNITHGSNLNSSQGDYMVLGQELADELGVSVGSKVTFGTTSAGTVGSLYTVIGIYSSSLGDLTGNVTSIDPQLLSLSEPVYILLSNAQALLNDSGRISSIGVECTSASDISLVASEINSTISGVSVISNSTDFGKIINGTYDMNSTYHYSGNSSVHGQYNYSK